MFLLGSLLNEHLPIWNQCSSVTPSSPSATMGSIFRFHSHFQSPTSGHWLIFFLALNQELAALQWLREEIDCFTFYWVFFPRPQNLTHLSPLWATATQMCMLLYKHLIAYAAWHSYKYSHLVSFLFLPISFIAGQQPVGEWRHLKMHDTGKGNNHFSLKDKCNLRLDLIHFQWQRRRQRQMTYLDNERSAFLRAHLITSALVQNSSKSTAHKSYSTAVHWMHLN